ncbi:very short patch repair endonuclease [Kribbella sp. NPDC056951]|uniref:very short patch repair endonuclease n=1 Tax=Kribbella sp. NPDC056951 TaxID=3345978 RepID=UPI00362C5CFC
MVVVSVDSGVRPADEAVSRRMSTQRRRDTEPELMLRRKLFAMGLRYRVNHPLPGLPRRRADITFTRAKVVVFVDGCFWHSCPQHATSPRRNSEWWGSKLEANRMRDRETDVHLDGLGWTVIRVWEHEHVAEAAAVIARAVRHASAERGARRK